MVSVMPSPGKYDDNFLNTFENMKEVIAGIRTIRKQNNIAFKDAISLRVKSNDRYPLQFESIICKMGNIQDVEMVSDTVKGAWSFICDTVEYFIPAVGEVNTEEVRAKLQADLAYAPRLPSVRDEKTLQREVCQWSPGTSCRERTQEKF